MATLMETRINAVTVTLTERDQYNDYSVVSDFYVSVNDPDTGYFRQWHCGTARTKAIECYRAAVAHVFKGRKARGASLKIVKA